MGNSVKRTLSSVRASAGGSVAICLPSPCCFSAVCQRLHPFDWMTKKKRCGKSKHTGGGKDRKADREKEGNEDGVIFVPRIPEVDEAKNRSDADKNGSNNCEHKARYHGSPAMVNMRIWGSHIVPATTPNTAKVRIFRIGRDASAYPVGWREEVKKKVMFVNKRRKSLRHRRCHERFITASRSFPSLPGTV